MKSLSLRTLALSSLLTLLAACASSSSETKTNDLPLYDENLPADAYVKDLKDPPPPLAYQPESKVAKKKGRGSKAAKKGAKKGKGKKIGNGRS